MHVHLGGSVDPAALWGIAHQQGIRLPTKDYWEFVDLITVRKNERKSFEEFLALYRWTELIQSSPLAVEASVYEVVRHLDPDRIGHGIHAAEDAALCKRIAERGILLEICPSSNLHTRVVRDADELGGYIATFRKHNVRFSFNTDGPEMLQTTLRDELRSVVARGWVSKDELAQCGEWARQASFLGPRT
ncbi:MAG: hypothetical protein Q7S41_04435 [Candidatus Limnocylindria bacterium]|nr:hypothetical protein [Candidatus Limnocylindria bacterium]